MARDDRLLQALRLLLDAGHDPFLALPNGIPCHDTFGRVFARLDPEQFQRCFLAWIQAVAGEKAAQVVVLDGKTLRRSHDRRAGKGALHMVSAWATSSRLVLAQVAVDAKSNEITALPTLPKLLALEGCTVTIDAMGCQTAIARQISEQGADYLLALKLDLCRTRSRPPAEPLIRNRGFKPFKEACQKRPDMKHRRDWPGGGIGQRWVPVSLPVSQSTTQNIASTT